MLLLWHIVQFYELPKMETIEEIVTVCVSLLVLIFLSNITKKTVLNFVTFYENISLVFKILMFLMVCDFISNVIVAIIITLVSFFLLSISESFADVGMLYLVISTKKMSFFLDEFVSCGMSFFHPKK